MIERRRNGQEEDEGQEGDSDCECQAERQDSGQEAAQAGVEDIAPEARVARSQRPPPQLVAVSLLEPLICIARHARFRPVRPRAWSLPRPARAAPPFVSMTTRLMTTSIRS